MYLTNLINFCLKLPLKIDIVKHSKELDGKSTAIHAVMLASKDVNIYTYPAIPNYADKKDVSFMLCLNYYFIN